MVEGWWLIDAVRVDALHQPSFDQPVSALMRRDGFLLSHDMSVQQALDAVRQRGLGEKIIYFYVIDGAERLVGVLPTRRLLTAPLDQRISEIMIGRVVAIP